MGRKEFTVEEICELEENPYVDRVDNIRITYSEEFKEHFIKEYIKGKNPSEIFREAGFDPEVLGKKRIEKAGYRWRKAYREGRINLDEQEKSFV
ncbi:MAG: HTH domain-containing protein [Anaerovoracaceae bacterium]